MTAYKVLLREREQGQGKTWLHYCETLQIGIPDDIWEIYVQKVHWDLNCQ